ncbi:polymerase II polypeptide I, 14.5kDa [Entophlyctis helioformis]|nr:polymerase II polypeptide I, 14.5kDa [Entophlyctis helioformis]
MASVKFCSECYNMLYPKEDKANRRLLFACRNCQHEEDADQTCVYQNIITHTAMEQTIVTIDLSSDPTFPRSKRPCPKCHYPESVFFQSRSKAKDATMKLFFACCAPNCGNRWSN